MKKRIMPRRKFITAASVAVSGVVAAPSILGAPYIFPSRSKSGSMIKGVQIGVITYSFRSMPDQSAEATLQYVLDTGIDAIELMGGPAESFAGMPESPIDRRALWRLSRKQRSGEPMTEDELAQLADLRAQGEAYRKEVAQWREQVSMDKFEKFRKMYNDAGVRIYGFKPNAFGVENTDAEINYGFKAAKALGASHVTLEHPSDDAHTMKLGKMAANHKMFVAYHGHEQQYPTFWDTALDQSKYNAMNPDLGHYIAAGNDNPLSLLSTYHKRIKSIHLKDRQTPSNGKANLSWGSGDTPIPQILQLMRSKSYDFPATIELEYQIPEGSDAVSEVRRCLEFCAESLG